MESSSVNIARAIMQAADHIEQNPWLFNYDSIYVPKCGTPGCALGWIGHFLNLKDPDRRDDLTNVCYVEAQIGRGDFYPFMRSKAGDWTGDAQACARGMRLFAQEFEKQSPRSDAELVADLMARVSGEPIPDDVHV